jgi:hypothetical protein
VSPGRFAEDNGYLGIDMSGWRPLIKGYFAALRLIVGAVMSKRCWLEMSTRIVLIPSEVDSTENMIDVFHCFVPNPPGVTSFDIGGEKRLLALGGPST